MISRREKDIYLSVCALETVSVLLLFGGFYLLNDFARQEWLPAPTSYLLISVAMLLALILEAITRPAMLRTSAGSTSRTQSIRIARRQALWLAAAFGVYLAFTRDAAISRLFLAGFVVLCMPLFYWSNLRGRGWLSKVLGLNRSKLRLRTLLIGSRDWADFVEHKLGSYREHLDIQRHEVPRGSANEEDLARDVAAYSPDLAVMSAAELPYEIVRRILSLGDRVGFRCWIPVELSRREGRRFEVQDVSGLSVLSPPELPLASLPNRALKRATDLAISVMVIPPVLVPLMAIVAILHRFQSPGPLFFRQQRVGRAGRTFTILKFRSMHLANDDEARQAAAEDPRVFTAGRWLRKLSLDEFPQFINVLRGEMSVVGPRPHMPAHERDFERFHELYGSRRYVKPGITGLAQVQGYRGEVKGTRDVRARARYDLFYVRQWTLSLDLALIARTLLTLVNPDKRAY